MKRILIIAGPNGAGKTTFATEYLPHEAKLIQFVNADLIAAGLSPFAPDVAAIQAARLMLSQMRRLLSQGESFALETTLSGRSYATQIPKWQAAGYRVELIYLSLNSVQTALSRVRARVELGGHNVPSNIVRRRFREGWRNFVGRYQHIVDEWALYDNSTSQPVLIDRGTNP